MALLKLNISNGRLYFRVEVGTTEEYKPDREIEIITKKVELLELKTKQKIKKIFGDVPISQAMTDVQGKPEVAREWKAYLEDEYNVDLKRICERIREKNKELCSGYTKYLENSK